MKWAAVGLFVLGLAAAICAAILVSSLQGNNASKDTTDGPTKRPVKIVIASHDLQPMTVVSASATTTREVPAAAVPENAISDPIQAVGKVLVVPVKEGQPLTSTHFASDGSSVHLASALEQGLRAVAIAMNDSMGLEGLLYPGSVVDVLTTIDIATEEGMPTHPMTFTLLENVRVLAVGDRTIVNPTGNEHARELMRRGQRPMVSLLVDTRQAEMLKLAMQEGSVTLSLRNPLDDSPAMAGGADLASLSPLLAGPSGLQGATPSLRWAPEVRVTEPSNWETVIVRGGKRETQVFEQTPEENN